MRQRRAFAGIVGTGLAIAATQNRRDYYDSYGYYDARPAYYGGGPAYYGGGPYYGGGYYRSSGPIIAGITTIARLVAGSR